MRSKDQEGNEEYENQKFFHKKKKEAAGTASLVSLLWQQFESIVLVATVRE